MIYMALSAFKKFFAFSVAVALLLFFAVSGMAAANNMQLNRVIAVVNGELITMYDLQQYAMPEIARRGLTGADSYSAEERERVFTESLDTMIMDILYKQEAERYQISVTDGEVEGEIRNLIQNNKMSPEEFEQQVALQGMSMDDLRKRLREGIMRQRILGAMVMRKAEVNAEEIEQYYNEHIKEFSTPSSVEFSVIMLGPGTSADEVLEKLAGGMSFAEAAKKYSASPTAALGGSMGNIPWSDLNPVWRESMQGLKPGQTAKPVNSGGTIVLLHVDALHEGSSQSLDDVAEKIENYLRETRTRERFDEFSNQLRSKAVVELKI